MNFVDAVYDDEPSWTAAVWTKILAVGLVIIVSFIVAVLVIGVFCYRQRRRKLQPTTITGDPENVAKPYVSTPAVIANLLQCFLL